MLQRVRPSVPEAPASSGSSPACSPSESLSRFRAETAVSPLLAVDLPIRGVVSGPVGSGKSSVLAALTGELAERGLRVGSGLPRSSDVDVVVIDDADALPSEDIEQVRALVEEPRTSVVIAHLPRPCAPLRELSARLEKTRPAVLLGEVEPEQIVEATRIPAHCAHAIVAQTGGVVWLALAAVDAHDQGECGIDPAHHVLARALRGVVAHRLERLDDTHRAAMEALCSTTATTSDSPPAPGLTWDELVYDGWRAGLLAPDGSPPPAVRSAVRALQPRHRVRSLTAADPWESAVPAWPDPAASTPTQLVARADALRADAPEQAWALYRHAASITEDTSAVALATGIAAFNAGDPDAAGAAFDLLLSLPDHPDRARAVEASVAVWAARSVLELGAESLSAPSTATARVALASLGARARLDPPAPGAPPEPPDTLTVALDVLANALVAAAGDDVERAVDDLVVASELYSATRCDFPLVEPPAVVAAAAALSTGRLELAASVLESAQERRQCGHWARPRILLWRAWIAIHAGEPSTAATLLAESAGLGQTLTARDRVIRAACETALARRYATTSELVTVFRSAARELASRRFDLFLFPFLGELSLAAVRADASDVMRRPMEAAFALLDDAGQPPLWSPLLHWAGVQRAILRGDPELLAPHARALLSTAERSPFAARLAAAGRIWTDVLAGHVDSAVVQETARDLCALGLSWDGARLAAHGAARTDDRAVYAQLLACARELHPTHGVRMSNAGADEPAAAPSPVSVLSDRETEVARLVVQGKTYVEIGHALFISPRTAEHHIARIRRRVDATSRSDLLTKLRAMLADDTETKTNHTREGS